MALRLTDEQWEQIREQFPEENIPDDRPGRKPVPARQVLEATLWILNTGAQGHMLPQCYPNHKTVLRHFLYPSPWAWAFPPVVTVSLGHYTATGERLRAGPIPTVGNWCRDAHGRAFPLYLRRGFRLSPSGRLATKALALASASLTMGAGEVSKRLERWGLVVRQAWPTVLSSNVGGGRGCVGRAKPFFMPNRILCREPVSDEDRCSEKRECTTLDLA